jgi:AraC family transcriptional regulator
MEPKIVSRPGFTIVGMKYHGKNENNEIPQMWQAIGPRFGEIGSVADPHTAYGISANTDSETGEFDYLAGLKVSSAEEIPEGMVRWEIPEGTYAVLPCTLPTIGETFKYAYHTWLPQSGYEPTGGPEYELYGPEFDPQDPDSTFELYIPIW